MNVMPVSIDQFIEAYETARESNNRIPSIDNSDGFRFQHGLPLLHLSGDAGVIVSEQTKEIASVFRGTKKGLGAEVIKTAIAWGGTWLYAWHDLEHLHKFYESLGFIKVVDVPCWHGSNTCMSYFALPGHEEDIRIKQHDYSCVSINEYLSFNWELAA